MLLNILARETLLELLPISAVIRQVLLGRTPPGPEIPAHRPDRASVPEGKYARQGEFAPHS
jgi:hypothetical protein